jgi:hypothetical protein
VTRIIGVDLVVVGVIAAVVVVVEVSGVRPQPFAAVELPASYFVCIYVYISGWNT